VAGDGPPSGLTHAPLAMSIRQRAVRRLIGQFHRPHGLGGRLAGWVMAHRSSNRRRNLWVVSLLDVQPTDRILEIGFGPGIAIHALSELATGGLVYGVDHSEVMVRQAAKRNAAAIRAGRVDLRCASVHNLPAFGAPLDKIMAVNSMGMWPEKLTRLTELRTSFAPVARSLSPPSRAAQARRKLPPNKRPKRSKPCSDRPVSPAPGSRPCLSTRLSCACLA
jgi:SAM-dependent methyltransferase